MVSSGLKSIVLLFVLLFITAAGPQSTANKDIFDPAQDLKPAAAASLDEDGLALPVPRDGSTVEIDVTQSIPGCCKICIVGKACGDSCIAKEETCGHLKGCACDAK